MLIIKIQNDGTGTAEVGNYRYQVLINSTVIESGDIKGHRRSSGWRKLVGRLLESSLFMMIGDYLEDELQARIAQLEAERDEWRADAERLAKAFVIEVYPHEWVCRSGCHHMGKTPDTIEHAPNCPITLHRQLEDKYK